MSLTTAELFALVVAIVALTKPFLDYLIDPKRPLHDGVLRVYTIVVAIVLQAMPSEILAPLITALTAMGLYHVVTMGFAQTPTTSIAAYREQRALEREQAEPLPDKE